MIRRTYYFTRNADGDIGMCIVHWHVSIRSLFIYNAEGNVTAYAGPLKPPVA